jgi:hypothetical protein
MAATSPETLAKMEALSGMQPGEVLIQTLFAGSPVVAGAKVNTGSPLDVALKALASNQYMPTAWTSGPLPLTTEGYAALVEPYNKALATDISRLADQGNIFAGIPDKIILVGGAVALAYMLIKR